MGMTRRDFIERGAMGAAAAAVTPRLFDAFGNLAHRDAQAGLVHGAVSATVQGAKLRIENELIAAEWSSASGLALSRVVDKRLNEKLDARDGAAFWISFEGVPSISSRAMKITVMPRVETLEVAPNASRYAERIGGKQIVAELTDDRNSIAVTWRAILREGSSYIRQEITVKAVSADLPIDEICLIDLPLENARVTGSVRGSPVVHGNWFLGFEHPLSGNAVNFSRARLMLHRVLPLKRGQSATYSSVIGATAPGQMRREFLQYVERERAHPYRTFFHYNTWYDFEPFDEAMAVGAIDAIGDELNVKRGVMLDSYLLDDGWDDHKFWGFNSGFPRGFGALKTATEKYKTAIGVWLSPWGGYAKARQERLEFGKQQGFEETREGLALSGPVYYKRFREVCLNMIRDYGVNQFKFDGTGSAANQFPGSEFGSDFEAAISLIGDLRAAQPNLYVNLTTGTYPSPFWLRYADSTWRGGEDHSFAGVGTPRQQWMTYRDADTYRNVVNRGPLYPLNALMLHGMIYARRAHNLETDPGNDFTSEVRSFFGTGTQLQEMYITPALLSAANWDALAEGAKWSRRNAQTLVDTHWVGGDPNLLEVYGWAAWGAKKAILTLRNPSERAQTFEFDAEKIFEVPGAEMRRIQLKSPWGDEASRSAVAIEAGKAAVVKLDAFEVRTFEG